MNKSLLYFWLFVMSIVATHVQAQSMLAEQRFEHLGVAVYAQHSSLRAGMTTTLAFRLRHDPHWHTYWKYPGDSGLPSKLKLRIGELPAIATELQWPVPKPLDVGGIHNVGYDGEVWLLADVAVPGDAQQTLKLAAELSWLVCKEECIPGRGDFVFELPITGAEMLDAAHLDFFAKARALLPSAAPADWMANFALDDTHVRFALVGDLATFAEAKSIELFVGSNSLAAIKPSSVELSPRALATVRAKHEAFTEAPNELELLWVVNTPTGERVGFRTMARKVSELAASGDRTDTGATIVSGLTPDAANATSITLPLALVLAFFGGLILNLMPCVLPVLSLKVMGLLEAGPTAVRAHGLYYSIGVISSFLALGALLLSLRSAGYALGWGFQLQSPALVAALSLLLFALALSMSGLVHFGYGLAGVGQNLADSGAGGHARSAFFSGVLACVVASPCTAPMMGTALGYALVQPAWVSLSVLATLGLGLAAPMLLLAAMPSLARRMPKPGAWMNTLKQALALPMYLSAIWLAWVFAQQRGVDALALLLVAAVLLGLGLTWLEQQRFTERKFARLFAYALIVSAVLPVFYALQPPSAVARVAWKTYSAESLQHLRELREPVLVEMTAAWCVTCKLNERVAMSGARFANSLRAKGVHALKGDWTDQDAAITSYLRSYGASGVPLVVLYSRKGSAEVLPQVLTPAIVEAALVRAAAR